MEHQSTSGLRDFDGFVVVGGSGSGKTTFARSLAGLLGLRHIELDALFHQENWVPTPPGEFQAKIDEAIFDAENQDVGWVACGNYLSHSGGIHHGKAGCVFWLDLSLSVIMRRVIARTWKRAVLRQELWNKKREKLPNFYHWNPERNIIRWAWTKYATIQSEYEAKLTDGSWDHLTVFRLRSRPMWMRFWNRPPLQSIRRVAVARQSDSSMTRRRSNELNIPTAASFSVTTR